MVSHNLAPRSRLIWSQGPYYAVLPRCSALRTGPAVIVTTSLHPRFSERARESVESPRRKAGKGRVGASRLLLPPKGQMGRSNSRMSPKVACIPESNSTRKHAFMTHPFDIIIHNIINYINRIALIVDRAALSLLGKFVRDLWR